MKTTTIAAFAALMTLAAAGHASADGTRTSIDGFGAVNDPAVVAAAPEAVRLGNEMLKGGDAYFNLAGTPCPGDYDELRTAVFGPRQIEDGKRIDAAYGLSTPIQALDARLVVLSGACPTGGVFSGPVEFIHFQKLKSGSATDVYITDSWVRRQAVYLNGNPIGAITAQSKTKTTAYKQLSSGELIETKSKFEAVAKALKSTHYVINFTTVDNAGALVSPSSNFSFTDNTPNVQVRVVRQVDGARQVVENYHDGAMISRQRLKNGILHGWDETWLKDMPNAAPMKTCFQNGQPIQATDCADN